LRIAGQLYNQVQSAITWRLFFTGCSSMERYSYTDSTEISSQNLIQLYTIPFTNLYYWFEDDPLMSKCVAK